MRPAGSLIIGRRETGAREVLRRFVVWCPSHGLGHLVRAVPLAPFIPSRVPGWAGGHGAGSRQGGGSGGANQRGALPPGRGRNRLRLRAWQRGECLAASYVAADPGLVTRPLLVAGRYPSYLGGIMLLT
jgi:hypothetical protein